MSLETILPRICRFGSLLVLLPFAAGNAIAQDDVDDSEEMEEIVTVGTQIRGANISDALAVSVFDSDDIEVLGVESGDELLDLIPENGQNFFNDAETISGGVNAARGDMGAFNLRNMGTGNTLVLMNGRRLVNSAAFQTELVGGDFVPVNTVNSNHIPVFGVDRVEVLRDGASAIYGADAVAGVVNTVLKDDYDGLVIRARFNSYDHVPRTDEALSIDWGTSFNGGATNVGVFARYFQRDRVSSRDETRWFNSDLRDRLPEDSIYREPNCVGSDCTEFRNDSGNSNFGQFDFLLSASGSGVRPLTDSAGDFETFPAGDPRCEWVINSVMCGAEDGNGTYRYNLNDNRDLQSELDRTTIYGYVNHELESGSEYFSEYYFYQSNTNMFRHPSAQFSSVDLILGAQNYYNPFGPCTSPNRINPFGDTTCGDSFDPNGLAMAIENFRYTERPRIVDNDGDAYRILQGIRGQSGDWDWEVAGVYSKANKDDITRNRVSNTLMQQALNDPTPAAYNPFAGGILESNIDRALVDVYRKSESSLAMVDFKFSNAELFEMPAGPAGVLFGYEWRRESFDDDRDDRLDGTIAFVDRDGDTYPEISDVVNSSPTPDGKGRRTTNSVFAELQLPLHETLDVQAAVRYENFDDVGDTTVGKLAFGWRPVDQLLVRGSWSEAFRAPNMVTINEEFIARAGTRNDWACFYAANEGGLDPDDFSDCDYSVQRQATGSEDLKPETSTNTSIGIVLEPLENLTITLDYWAIEKKDVIGLTGRENHMYYDLVLRLQSGIGNATVGDLSDCANITVNPVVTRDDDDVDDFSDAEIQSFLDAGLCPFGNPINVMDSYENLDTRTIEGHDLGIYYDIETGIGDFSFRYNGSFYDKYEQENSSTISNAIVAAQASNPALIFPIKGLGDLQRIDGNQKEKHTASLSWRKDAWGASVSGFRIGSFLETLSNSDRWYIPSMTTYNAKFDYRFDVSDVDMRVRLGVNNFTDERAPLSDSYFGYFSDAHRDLGIYYYVDLRAEF